VTSGISEALAPCVHCGFCLPACPTYLATGDESDSPRGRILLMRALASGEIDPHDAALNQHLDACLGCRGCEPACPSGVAYGRGLEQTRKLLADARGLPPAARTVLAIFRRQNLWKPLLAAARWFRGTGAAKRLAGDGPVGFLMGMLAASRMNGRSDGPRVRPSDSPTVRPSVALFRGCVMDTLFPHVHAATRRTLEANGYHVVEVAGQGCCGALHDHAGGADDARELARENVTAFTAHTGFVAVNSAGCGAILKDYGHLVGTPEAVAFAGRVRDVTELLADAGPRPGGPLTLEVAYDAPCHLQHAQRVHEAPIAVLRAIQGLRLRLLPGADRCCGSAGIFSLVQPAMSRAVLADKIDGLRAANPVPQVVATGNPGCVMQIGAGVLAAGLPIRVMHPVELLDEAYQIAGLY
jgi:glycolate dehydrogenase iron-sulfur subunit